MAESMALPVLENGGFGGAGLGAGFIGGLLSAIPAPNLGARDFFCHGA